MMCLAAHLIMAERQLFGKRGSRFDSIKFQVILQVQMGNIQLITGL